MAHPSTSNLDYLMQPVNTLIRTKLCHPFIRPGLVTRPRLQARITDGLQGPLTLVIAPAGFGKTTLVTACITDCRLKTAWLSLDIEDNRPGRFLHYLVAALQMADNTIGGKVAQLMAETDQASSETILTGLINDLDIAKTEIALVLDDYQCISSQAVHEAVTFLLDHCPNSFHLVIATRSDPPLPLARLRARSHLVEIRAADLRFTPAEANQFLNDVMGLHLEADLIGVLEARTEGWIAGLQMASLALQGSLSMRDHRDVRGFIKAFSGTNRYILDYLIEEVLASQPEEVQRFLLCTSILERMTTPLCEEVLKAVRIEDWNNVRPSANPNSTQPILTYLERANLFLVSLDDEQKWYRYHHLFADLLRNQLNQLHPGISSCLHARAAVWYEANGFYEEAIHHTLAAGDYLEAARLVEAFAENAWLDGHYASILTWTKSIPLELIYSRPWLCIWNAWASTQMGDSQMIDQWITAADLAANKSYGEQSTISDSDANADAQALMNEIAALRAFSVSFLKDYERAIELAETVLKNPPIKNRKVAQFTRCNLLHLLSSMYFATGNLIKAEKTCRETIELANEMDFILRQLHCTNKLILVHTANGHLHRSYQLIEETLSFLHKQGFQDYFAVLQLYFRKIELLYEWNQLEEYQRMVEFVLEQKPLVDILYLLVDSYNIQALDLMFHQDYSGSQYALNNARTLSRKSYIWEGLTWPTEALQVRLWLKKGELGLAVEWASQKATDHENILRFSDETRAIALARILLAQNAYQDTLSLLNRLSPSAEAEERNGSLIMIHALRAIAFFGMEKNNQAVAEVEKALALAESEGYVRTFLDEGQPMLTLLSQVANDSSSPNKKYALRLLTAVREEQGSVKPNIQRNVSAKDRAAPLPHESNALLVEPLSQRELEVLHLMALGRTNQEIAKQLIVATGTVKAHAASIYRKLDAANRTEAVARARKLGLFS